MLRAKMERMAAVWAKRERAEGEVDGRVEERKQGRRR
jgi:hypothetical protein